MDRVHDWYPEEEFSRGVRLWSAREKTLQSGNTSKQPAEGLYIGGFVFERLKGEVVGSLKLKESWKYLVAIRNLKVLKMGTLDVIDSRVCFWLLVDR